MGLRKHTKRTAGRLGGLRTVEKHGREHMQKIGKRGAEVTWERHTLKPVNESQYAMVRREDNVIVAIW